MIKKICKKIISSEKDKQEICGKEFIDIDNKYDICPDCDVNMTEEGEILLDLILDKEKFIEIMLFLCYSEKD